MGLLSILRKIKEKEKEVRILILGLDNAGKTTVCKRLCGQPTDDIEPTLGFNIQTLQHQSKGGRNGDNHHSTYQLNLWDVGGQATIRAYWRNYFEQTDGLVWVVDSADAARLALCRHELQALLGHEKLAGATLLILANKQDVPGAVSLSQVKRALELDNDDEDDDDEEGKDPTTTTTTTTTSKSLGDKDANKDSTTSKNNNNNNIMENRHWSVRPCSAVTGQGLVEAMDWLVEDIGSRIFLLS